MMRLIGYSSLLFVFVGCSQATPDSQGSFNLAGAPTVQFSVPDMMCKESCAVKTKEILSKVPGAKDVIVDFDTKTATVAVDEGKFDSKQAIAELVDHGFDHSSLTSEMVKTDATEASATPPARVR